VAPHETAEFRHTLTAVPWLETIMRMISDRPLSTEAVRKHDNDVSAQMLGAQIAL
jgi:hypothetical protein